MEKKLIRFIIIMTIIVLIQLSITISVYYIIKNNDSINTKNKMMEISKTIINNLNTQIYTIKYTLDRNSAFIRTYGIYISTDQYIDLIQLNNSPSKSYIESYIWILKLKYNEKNKFQNYCRQNIITNCTIKQINMNTFPIISFKEVDTKSYYYPLIFTYPLLSYLQYDNLIGLDLNSSNTPINIIDIEQNKENFVVTKSLFKNNNSIIFRVASYADRDNSTIDNIYGYSACIINIENIITQVIINLNISINRNDIDVFIFDIIKNETNLLYKENKIENYHTIILNYDIAGRKWIVFFNYSQNFINKNTSNLLIIIPLIICGICILIDIIMIILYQYHCSLKKTTEIEKTKRTIAMQMLAYVNHEIRNPLNVIKGLVIFTLDNMRKLDIEADNIRIDKTSFETVISDLSTVAGSCNMLEHIVADILDIRKLEAGKLQIENKMINMDNFVKDIIKTISQKIDEKQTVNLITIYDNQAILFFDPFRLKQILLNFLTNSIKYTDQGSITLKIEEINNMIKFSVIDTGRGIKEENKCRIFEPFNQLNPEDTYRHNGIGLGLYLCKMLIELMHGNIGFESEYKKGTTFWIEIPIHIIKP